MAHTFTIEVTVERVAGKFAPRDEIADALATAVEDADLYGLGADGESEYNVEDVSVLPAP